MMDVYSRAQTQKSQIVNIRYRVSKLLVFRPRRRRGRTIYYFVFRTISDGHIMIIDHSLCDAASG